MWRFLLIVNMCLSLDVWAQKEAYNWQFGNRTDLTFHSKPPSPLNKSQMYSNEGCASISSYDGKLLFYSNGESVWDSTHNIMPNGNGLYGSNTTAQSCIALPFPSQPKKYVLFTLDQIYGTHGLNYSIIDMQLNNNKGDVISTQKNIHLIDQSFVTEKLSAVLHANGRDYWIICPQAGTDSFYAFLLDPSGVHHQAVMSNTSFKLAWKSGTDKIGCLKSSPNGQYFAYANINMDTLVFGQFNHQSGKVTTAWSIYAPQCYGVEFSPNSQVLYVTLPTIFRIQQYVCSNNKANFIASLKYIANTQYPYGIQLGPDEKIYVNCLSRDDLSIIHAPDSIGTACRFQYRAIPLKSNSKDSRLGLPQYLPQFLFGNDVFVKNQCLNDTTKFHFINNNRDSAVWNFGDTLGQNNTSNGTQNIYHIYKQTGLYRVKVIYYKHGLSYVKYLTVNIQKSTPIQLSNDTSICENTSAVLYVKNAKNFKQKLWQTGSQSDSIMVQTSGSISIIGIDQNDCQSSDTVHVNIIKVQANIQYHDTSYCLNDNQFPLKAQYLITNDQLKVIRWQFSDNTSSQDSIYTKRFHSAGQFTIKLVIESKQHCKDSFERSVYVIPQPKARIIGRDSSFCYQSSSIHFSALNTSKQCKWTFSDGQSDTQLQSQHLYAKAGKYNIHLIQFDSSLCQTSDSITLTLQEAKPNIQFNQASFCFLSQNINAEVQTGFKYVSWQWGDGFTDTGRKQRHFYMGPAQYIITSIVQDSLGCTGKDSILINIHYTRQRIVAQTDTLCEHQQPYTFNFNSSLQNVQINWSDGSLDSGKSILKTFNTTGLHTGYVCSTDSFACRYFDTIKTYTMPSAKAAFDYQINPCEGILFVKSTASNTAENNWLIDTLHSHQAYGYFPLPKQTRFTITLIALDAYKRCSDTIRIKLQQDSGSLDDVIIPNVFTPNQDMFNNCYTLGGLHPECGDKALIQIFDRWGIMVFESDLAQTCWQGTNKQAQELSSGVYYYILNLKTNKVQDTLEGVIHLIR